MGGTYVMKSGAPEHKCCGMIHSEENNESSWFMRMFMKIITQT